jgi:hypothetical protein
MWNLINNKKYFIDAIRLLDKQIDYNNKNPLFLINFDFFHDKYNRKLFHNKNNIEKYYNNKINNNIFYSLENDFYIYHYPIPKWFFWIRNYTFFSYELYIVYYAIWIYIYNISKKSIEYKNQLSEDLEKNNSFYKTYSWTKINYNWDKVVVWKTVFKYHKHYNDFYRNIKKYSNPDTENKIIIKLDLQNFFDDINIEILLNFLDWNIINNKEHWYNNDMKKEIIDFFHFIWFKKWIPQSDDNLISQYLSDLFLLKSDFKIIDFLKLEWIKFSFIRYVDDTFFIFNESDLWKYKEQPFLLLQKFSNIIYDEVGIRLNNTKNSFFYINHIEKWKYFLKKLKNISQVSHVIEDNDDWDIDDKIKNIFDTICKIKILPDKDRTKSKRFMLYWEWSHELVYKNQDINKLNNIFSKDKEWNNILKKILKTNNKKVIRSFKWFNFNYINFIYKPLIALIEWTKNYKNTNKIYKKFIKFMYRKKLNSFYDTFLLSKYIIKYYSLFKKNENEILKSKYSFLHLFYNDIKVLTSSINWFYKGFDLTLDITEQIKYRIIFETSKDYSRAFNHLLNEFHNIIYHLDKKCKIKMKKYDQNNVKNYLLLIWYVESTYIIEVWNFFDRRNKNNISHWNWISIEKEEYIKYKKLVLDIYIILSKKI